MGQKTASPSASSFPVVFNENPFAPGELITLVLFEPRWISLFSKLTSDGNSPNATGTLKSASGSNDASLDVGPQAKVLKWYELDPSKKKEKEELMESLQDYFPYYWNVKPGYGRLDESPFVGTNRFAVIYKPFGFEEVIGLQGKAAAVGTIAEIVATDV